MRRRWKIGLAEPAAEAADSYRHRFGVRVEIVPGAGHSPMVEQPAATARLLRDLDRGR